MLLRRNIILFLPSLKFLHFLGHAKPLDRQMQSISLSFPPNFPPSSLPSFLPPYLYIAEPLDPSSHMSFLLLRVFPKSFRANWVACTKQTLEQAGRGMKGDRQGKKERGRRTREKDTPKSKTRTETRRPRGQASQCTTLIAGARQAGPTCRVISEVSNPRASCRRLMRENRAITSSFEASAHSHRASWTGRVP
jgi:hypothetical protein